MMMTLKMTSPVATTTAWVKFVFIGSILRPARLMGSMKPPALRSTSINRRMPLPSRASQRRSQWKNLYVSRRNRLYNSSLLRHSRFNSNLCSSPCNSSLRSRYNSRSSLFMYSQRHSPLRLRTLSQSRSSSLNRLSKSRSVKKR